MTSVVILKGEEIEDPHFSSPSEPIPTVLVGPLGIFRRRNRLTVSGAPPVPHLSLSQKTGFLEDALTRSPRAHPEPNS
jgi:hypothetical protein